MPDVLSQQPLIEALPEEWMIAAFDFPEIQREAELEVAQFIGDIVVATELVVEPVETRANPTTLLAKTQEAKLGDERAREIVRTNVVTDLIERNRTVAHQNTVWLELEQGRIGQNGVFLADVHRNALENAPLDEEMTKITLGECTAPVVIEKLAREGILETHDAVVIELAAVSEETRKNYNYHTTTDTASFQHFRKQDNKVRLQTAMVAGKKAPDAPRHDVAAVQHMANSHRVESLPVDVASDMVQYIWIIPKEQIPHGVEDVVAEYDKYAGTFYGQDKPQQDYQEYAAYCEELNDGFNDLVETITDQLISEAHAFTTPLEAIERLDYLSGRMSAKRAATDLTINPAVFGPVSAAHIEEARRHYEKGETQEAEQATRKAQNTEQSNSCPMFKMRNGKGNGEGDSDTEDSSEKKWMNCPHCSAKVFDDPCAKILSCWDCKARVINSVVFSKGDGGSKRREAEKAKREAEMAAKVEAAFKETQQPALV